MDTTQADYEGFQHPKLFEVKIPVRGYSFSLKQIKSAYVAFQDIADREGERQLVGLIKPDEKTDEQFVADKAELRENAFRITVSIIGHNNVTVFGSRASVFDKLELPFPIKTIYMTNETAFARYASGKAPQNHIQLWVHFYKTPVLDQNPLNSDPTVNLSEVVIKANDLTFFSACRTVVTTELMASRLFYYPIHLKFAYDVGLWLLGLPYILYFVSNLGVRYIKDQSAYEPYRIAFLLYGFGMGLVAYKLLFGYMRWAFPVNTLVDNEDLSSKHRWLLGAIILGLVTSLLSKLLGI